MKKLKPANQNPDFRKVCIHGSLKRQCYTCELEVSNDWLKKVNQDLRDEIERMNKAIEVCEKHWELVAGYIEGHESRQGEISELKEKCELGEGCIGPGCCGASHDSESGEK